MKSDLKHWNNISYGSITPLSSAIICFQICWSFLSDFISNYFKWNRHQTIGLLNRWLSHPGRWWKANEIFASYVSTTPCCQGQEALSQRDGVGKDLNGWEAWIRAPATSIACKTGLESFYKPAPSCFHSTYSSRSNSPSLTIIYAQILNVSPLRQHFSMPYFPHNSSRSISQMKGTDVRVRQRTRFNSYSSTKLLYLKIEIIRHPGKLVMKSKRDSNV